MIFWKISSRQSVNSGCFFKNMAEWWVDCSRFWQVTWHSQGGRQGWYGVSTCAKRFSVIITWCNMIIRSLMSVFCSTSWTQKRLTGIIMPNASNGIDSKPPIRLLIIIHLQVCAYHLLTLAGPFQRYHFGSQGPFLAEPSCIEHHPPSSSQAWQRQMYLKMMFQSYPARNSS